MFTEQDRKMRNWRGALRKLEKARNKRDKLVKRLEAGKHDAKDSQSIKQQIVDLRVKISVLELRIGDKPE